MTLTCLIRHGIDPLAHRERLVVREERTSTEAVDGASQRPSDYSDANAA